MNSYFFNNFFSRIIIFSTIFCIILSFIISDFWLNILAFSGILTFGIIHGANDLLLINKVSDNKNIKLQFIYYILMVFGFFIFFYKIQILALITFVLLSSFHFGEHQWTLYEKSKKKLIKVFYFNYGLTIFSLIFYFNFIEVNEIIFDITTQELGLDFFYYLLLGSSLLTLFSVIIFYQYLKSQLIIQIILLILLIFTLNFSTLIWSFGIYFVFWHSIPSIVEQTKFIYGKSKSKSIGDYFKKAFIYWILSLIGLLFTYYFFKESQSQLLSIFFSFLASITFPHTFVISKIKKPSLEGFND